MLRLIQIFLFSNQNIDAAQEEKKQRQKYPYLLHKDEKVLLAWQDRGGMGRDKNMFTSHRILMKDGKGLTSKRKNYKSIPYSAIQGKKSVYAHEAQCGVVFQFKNASLICVLLLKPLQRRRQEAWTGMWNCVCIVRGLIMWALTLAVQRWTFLKFNNF